MKKINFKYLKDKIELNHKSAIESLKKERDAALRHLVKIEKSGDINQVQLATDEYYNAEQRLTDYKRNI